MGFPIDHVLCHVRGDARYRGLQAPALDRPSEAFSPEKVVIDQPVGSILECEKRSGDHGDPEYIDTVRTFLFPLDPTEAWDAVYQASVPLKRSEL